MSNALLILLAATAVSVSPDSVGPDQEQSRQQPYGTVLSFDFEADEDREPDGLPDDWNRRRGPGFPTYVACEIDEKHSHIGDQSLHSTSKSTAERSRTTRPSIRRSRRLIPGSIISSVDSFEPSG